MTLEEKVEAIDKPTDKVAIKKDERPAITKKDVKHFLRYCSDNDLLKVLFWAVGEVWVRFHKSKHSECKKER